MVHCTINTIIPQRLWDSSPLRGEALIGSYQNLTADQRGLVNGFFFPDEEDGAVGTAPAGKTSFLFLFFIFYPVISMFFVFTL